MVKQKRDVTLRMPTALSTIATGIRGAPYPPRPCSSGNYASGGSNDFYCYCHPEGKCQLLQASGR